MTDTTSTLTANEITMARRMFEQTVRYCTRRIAEEEHVREMETRRSTGNAWICDERIRLYRADMAQAKRALELIAPR